MCGFVICMLCAVIITNTLSAEIPRNKRHSKYTSIVTLYNIIIAVAGNYVWQTFDIRDEWIWGYYKEKPDKNNATLRQANDITARQDAKPENPTTAEPLKTTPSFCNPSYVPPAKPDFRAPGRRISETKCHEYIWELKNRKKTADENRLCAKLKFGTLLEDIYIGGRDTSIGEFPHMGAVGWKATVGTWVFKCGSSLISEKFVLTAAHCTKASTSDTKIADVVPKIVRLGDRNISDKIVTGLKQDAIIARIIVHPQFKPPVKYYDIALMELNEKVKFSKFVQPACLWNKFSTSELGTQATGTGWGVTEADSIQISQELQVATVDVLETSQCEELLKTSRNRNWGGFHDDQLCAGKLAGGVDSCQGDSGGPLQMKIPLPSDVTENEGSMHYVIGIVSFGVGCAHQNRPGVYTRVSSFIDWIEDNVWGNQ